MDGGFDTGNDNPRHRRLCDSEIALVCLAGEEMVVRPKDEEGQGSKESLDGSPDRVFSGADRSHEHFVSSPTVRVFAQGEMRVCTWLVLVNSCLARPSPSKCKGALILPPIARVSYCHNALPASTTCTTKSDALPQSLLRPSVWHAHRQFALPTRHRLQTPVMPRVSTPKKQSHIRPLSRARSCILGTSPTPTN